MIKKNPTWICVDIGGTKVSIGIAEEEHWIHKVTFPTEADKGTEKVIKKIVDTIKLLLEKCHRESRHVCSLVVGVPGSVNLKEGIVISAPNIGWNNVPLKEILEAKIGLPVFIDQDTKLAAWGEYIYGVGRGTRNFAYVTVSTGVGCGLILDGKIFRGSSNMAGEIGHIVVDPSGPACTCGSKGCLQMFSSGPAIAKEALNRLSQSYNIKDTKLHKEKIRTEDIIRAALDSDEFALSIVRKAFSKLALGISHIINLLDIEKVALGGGVVFGSKGLALSMIRNEISRYVYPPQLKKLEIVESTLGCDIVLIGALLVAMQGWEN